MHSALIFAQLAWMNDTIFVGKVQPHTMAEANGQWLLTFGIYMYA